MENEFTPDSIEAYEQEEALKQQGELDSSAGNPPLDNIEQEPPADVEPTVEPEIAQVFDRNTVIPGLDESRSVTAVEGESLETKKKLANEPKTRMMIPFDNGEKAGAYRSVIINGYRFDIQKNKMVDLPASVAKLLTDSYSITSDVVENNEYNLDRNASGKRDALGL